MDILKTIKILLRIKDDEQDEILQLYIDIVIQRILIYCNINELPEELDYTVAEMVVDIWNEQLTKDKILSGTQVSGITEDGRTVNFNTSNKVTDVQIAIDERISKKALLNRFKLLYKT